MELPKRWHFRRAFCTIANGVGILMEFCVRSIERVDGCAVFCILLCVKRFLVQIFYKILPHNCVKFCNVNVVAEYSARLY